MLKKPTRGNTPVDASRSPRPHGAPKSPKARKVQVEPPSAPDFYCDTPGPETSARYVPGGYHPVHIGDIYLERYRVIHKLGYGVDSTVWLARDLFSTERTRYVSLKFVIAELTGRNNEIKIYRHLASQSGRTHPGSEYVLAPLDQFRVRGVNGEHEVLVFPVLGPHIGDVLFQVPDMKPWSIKSLMRQIVLGVSFLHDCGIVHGDLYTSNIALEIHDLDGEPQKNVFMAMGSPECVPSVTRDPQNQIDKLPKYRVTPKNLMAFVKRDNVRVKIIDFGQAFFVAEPPQDLYSPLPFRAPEGMFNRLSKSLKIRYGPQVDIWSIGSLLYELATSRPLISTYAFDEAMALRDLTTLLGPVPQEWIVPLGASLPPAYNGASLEKSLRSFSGVENAPEWTALLLQILVFEPSQRPGALEILDHPWLKIS